MCTNKNTIDHRVQAQMHCAEQIIIVATQNLITTQSLSGSLHSRGEGGGGVNYGRLINLNGFS